MPNVRDKASVSSATKLSRSSEDIETVEFLFLTQEHNRVEDTSALYLQESAEVATGVRSKVMEML